MSAGQSKSPASQAPAGDGALVTLTNMQAPVDGAFLTLANIRECEAIFKRYMANEHAIVVPDSRSRVVLYKIMNDIRQRNVGNMHIHPLEVESMDLTRLNNLVLNVARDVFIASASAGSSSDQQGERRREQKPRRAEPRDSVDYLPNLHPPSYQMLLPMPHPSAEQRAVAVAGGTRDDPIHADEFARRLNDIEYERQMVTRVAQVTEVRQVAGTQVASSGVQAQVSAIQTGGGGAQVSGIQVSAMQPGGGGAQVSGIQVSAMQPGGGGAQVSGIQVSAIQPGGGRAQVSGAQARQRGPLIRDVMPAAADECGPTSEYPEPLSSSVRFAADTKTSSQLQIPAQTQIQTQTQTQTLTQTQTQTQIRRYVVIAGFDRDLTVDKMRYDFNIDVGGTRSGCLQTSYKSVTSIETQCVILPSTESLDVQDRTTVASSLFGLPYVTLHLDNVTLCEGTNDTLRGALAVMRFERSYRSPNGRSYIVLLPMQGERKTFSPPLASLPNFRMSLRRPNGTLLENSRDDFGFMKIEYEAFNQRLVKIVTSKYFDPKEFLPGDNVYMRQCTIQLSAILEASAAHRMARDTLQAFLNRAEGHQIVELGQSNAKGFCRTFYLAAPGVANQVTGAFDLDVGVTDLIQSINNDVSIIPSSIQGMLLNASLQAVISMTVTVTMSR